MSGVKETLPICFAMGAVIFFCRVFPFLFFRETGGTDNSAPSRKTRFLSLVEKTVPPVIMTVLAFNALAAPVRADPGQILPVLISAGSTALLHLWKRNTLLSIAAGTALYMLLERALSFHFNS